MKRAKGVIISLGLVLMICGCGANTSVEQVSDKEEMTVLQDELVSTSEKLDIQQSEVEVETVEELDSEEHAQDKESIETSSAVENKESAETEDNLIYQDGIVSSEDLAIKIGDVLVNTGDDINVLLEKLGTPDDFVQARSCLYDGDDKVFTYGGIVIYTYPNGAEDIVYLIEVEGDEKLLSGIGVGSSWTDMIAVYGEEYVVYDPMVSYELSETACISFQMENNIISFVEIYNE